MSIIEYNPFVNPVSLQDGDYDWNGQQVFKNKVGHSYSRIGRSKNPTFKYNEKFLLRADKIYHCFNYIQFKRSLFDKNEDGSPKRALNKAYTCKDPLCVGCNVRRSRKIRNQMRDIMDYLKNEHENGEDLEYLFLTLTARNCEMDELSRTIDLFMNGFSKFRRRKEFGVFKGWYRALEVTFVYDEFITPKLYKKKKTYYDKRGLGVGDREPNFRTFHPHFHCLLVVDKNYFKSKDYISHSEFTRLWRECLGVDYDPIIKVQKVDKKTIKSESELYDGVEIDTVLESDSLSTKSESDVVSEIAKYTVKHTDYIFDDNLDLTDEVVYYLIMSISGRRLVSYGGILKNIHHLLHLGDDPINGDLINVGDKDEIGAYVLEDYKYTKGANGLMYYLSATRLPEELDNEQLKIKASELTTSELAKRLISKDICNESRKKNTLDTIDEYNMNLAMDNKKVHEHDGEKIVSYVTPKEVNKKNKIKTEYVYTLKKPPATFEVKSFLRLFNDKKCQISKISYNDLRYLNYYMQKENKNSSLAKKVASSCVKNLSGTDDYKKRCVIESMCDYFVNSGYEIGK